MQAILRRQEEELDKLGNADNKRGSKLISFSVLALGWFSGRKSDFYTPWAQNNCFPTSEIRTLCKKEEEWKVFPGFYFGLIRIIPSRKELFSSQVSPKKKGNWLNSRRISAVISQQSNSQVWKKQAIFSAEKGERNFRAAKIKGSRKLFLAIPVLGTLIFIGDKHETFCSDLIFLSSLHAHMHVTYLSMSENISSDHRFDGELLPFLPRVLLARI